MSKFSKNLALWLVIGLLLVALFNLFQTSVSRTPTNSVTYSQFMQDADRGQVESVLLRGNNISARMKTGKTVTSYAANDPGFVQRLIDKGIVVAAGPADATTPSWTGVLISWFPMLLLIGVWIYFMRRMRGGGANSTQARLDDLQARVIALESKAVQPRSARDFPDRGR